MTKTLYVFVFLFTLITQSGYVNADDNSQKILIQDISWMYGLTLGDDLKYGEDFQYFDYVNSDAPKRGTLVQAAIGSFDTLNPFNMKGVPAIGSSYYIYDSLLKNSDDEPFSYYGLLAEGVYHPEDYSYVIYKLRDDARWHDGQGITAHDVKWSLETLKGINPNYKYYYNNVVDIEVLSDKIIKFNFDISGNRELPLITGQFPILPKHYWESDGRLFGDTTLDFPLGSGPYKFKEVNINKNVIYERVTDYWGKDLSVNKGFYNFDELVFEYFRDRQVQLEAFKANEIDIVFENSSKRWATGYDFTAKDNGDVKLEVFRLSNVQGMQAFAMNLRRDKFRDISVRKALNLAFDFEWLNANLFYNQYQRIDSFFDNSELESVLLPEGKENEILLEVSNLVHDDVFNKEYKNSVGGTAQNIRNNLRIAQGLLKDAGYDVKDGKLIDKSNGQPFLIEFLISQPDMERIISQFQTNLRSIGIESNIRLVDTAQYQERMDQFDFDMVVATFPQSLSPGNEQRDYWGSESASSAGSRNIIGIQNEAVDILIDKIIYSETRADLIASTKALDRVLKWNYYVIPHYYSEGLRIARWDIFEFNENLPEYNVNLLTWWSK
jgi:microcin C transport system substrate-binding protein